MKAKMIFYLGFLSLILLSFFSSCGGSSDHHDLVSIPDYISNPDTTIILKTGEQTDYLNISRFFWSVERGFILMEEYGETSRFLQDEGSLDLTHIDSSPAVFGKPVRFYCVKGTATVHLSRTEKCYKK